MVLIFISLLLNFPDVSYAHWIFSLLCFRSVCPLLLRIYICLSFFKLLSCKNILYILNTNPLSDMFFFWNVFTACGMPIHVFLRMNFDGLKLLRLIRHNLSLFPLNIHCFRILAKGLFPISGRSSPMFSSKVFLTVAFILRLYNQPEIDVMQRAEHRSKFGFFQIYHHHL